MIKIKHKSIVFDKNDMGYKALEILGARGINIKSVVRVALVKRAGLLDKYKEEINKKFNLEE